MKFTLTQHLEKQLVRVNFRSLHTVQDNTYHSGWKNKPGVLKNLSRSKNVLQMKNILDDQKRMIQV